MAKKWAMIWGWIFIILGILGFFSNPIIGASGYFAADAVHNVIDLIIGIVFLWVAYGAPMKSAATLKWIGIILIVIAILGFFTAASMGKEIGLFLVNAADNWLHLILGIVLTWAGIAGGKKNGMQAQQASQQM